MIGLEKTAEKSKNNMYNNTLDGISAFVQQPAFNPPTQLIDQHDDNMMTTENSLMGAQSVTAAIRQSNQLTTNIPNYSPNSTEIA